MTDKPLTQANNLAGNLLRRCHQSSVALFLKQCAPQQLTQLQYVILAALEEVGPSDQLTLGRLTALDRNTVAVVVKKLEVRGLVHRCRRHDDRRFMQVSLTVLGRATRKAAQPNVLITQDEILAPLNTTEQRQLVALLQKMADANNARSRVPLESAV